MTVVGVRPAGELRARGRLFSALAQAFPLRFEPVDVPGRGGVDAVIELDGDPGGTPADGPAKRLVVARGSGTPGRRTIRFGDATALDARLRGRSVVEAAAAPSPLRAHEGDSVLALADDDPVWLRRATAAAVVDVVACAPAELSSDEPLRDRLDRGRFLELLPLVHFLREVSAGSRWEAPPPRAVFVVDDPNLHRPSYGYLRYPELVRHARDCSYHISMAMVPADGWYAHRGTVRLFRENDDVLSLCLHGNDHRRHELGRLRSSDEARRVVAQAVRRIASFRRRTGLAVSPVMVPPHEACSEETMAAMLELGLEAATVTRPYPWMPFGDGHSPHSTPVPGNVLSGWRIAELMPDGFPVMIRRELSAHDDVVLRRFLDQPLILYGHVSDFADGLEPLASAAAVVNASPGVRWGSLGELARTNFEHRRDGAVLEVRPFARAITVSVEPEIAEIRLRPPGAVDGFRHGVSAAFADAAHAHATVDGDTVALPPGRTATTTVEIHWRGACEVAAERVPRPASGAGAALARRVLTEGRDRAAPLVRASRRSRRGFRPVAAPTRPPR